ncbi:MAG: SDR family oxidoreductase [Betaproteobacteria bacterium]|nr:SDR family oxidoreductase [Betaproteobacteria bacterium]
MSLSGQVALITGASRNPGLGRTIALAFAAKGIHIVLGGRTRKDVLEANAAEVRARGVKALPYLADITDPAQVEAMVTATVKQFGGIDILVNCAGARGDVGLLDMTVEQWRTVLSVNLDGAFNCVRAAAPHMIRRSYGRIISMAGISGQLGDPHRAHLVTAKAGLIGFTKAVAVELGRHGVTANAVSPGIIDTPRPAGAALEKRRKRIVESPLGRAGSGEDIANACLFLASDEAAFITGQTLSVNGGAFMP